MSPKVYILILNYKKWQDAKDCLDSVLQLEHENYSVFVIDNHSQNNSVDHLIHWLKHEYAHMPLAQTESGNAALEQIDFSSFTRKEFQENFNVREMPKIIFIENDENRGFAAGNNLVIEKLVNEDAYLWLLNPDMIVEPSTLTELVEFACSSPSKSIIGATIKFHVEPDKIHLLGGAQINFNSAAVKLITSMNNLSKIDYISGGSFFTHASHFRELGLLPEDYFLYWEETDWCYHAKQKGYQMLLCAKAVCYDKISSTIGKGFLADYFYTRNGLLFISRYQRKKIPLALLSAFMRLLKRFITGQWQRARGVYLGILSFLNRRKDEIQ